MQLDELQVKQRSIQRLVASDRSTRQALTSRQFGIGLKQHIVVSQSAQQPHLKMPLIASALAQISVAVSHALSAPACRLADDVATQCAIASVDSSSQLGARVLNHLLDCATQCSNEQKHN